MWNTEKCLNSDSGPLANMPHKGAEPHEEPLPNPPPFFEKYKRVREGGMARVVTVCWNY